MEDKTIEYPQFSGNPVWWFTPDGTPAGNALSGKHAAALLQIPEGKVSYARNHPRHKLLGFYFRKTAEFTPPPGSKSIIMKRVKVTDNAGNETIYESITAAKDAIGGSFTGMKKALAEGVPYKRRWYLQFVKEQGE